MRDLVALALLLAIMAIIASHAFADERGRGHGHEGGQDTEVITDVTTKVITGDVATEVVTGDVSTGDLIGGDTTAYTVVAPGLGDVDIGACLGSTQWTFLVGGKQKLRLNHICMAEFYLQQGRYDLAAQSLCNQKEIRKEYKSEQACEDAHDFTPLGPPPDLGDLYSRSAKFDEHYEISQAQEQEIEYLQEEQATLVGRIDALTAQIEKAPRKQAKRAPVEKPAERYSDDDYNKVLAILKGEEWEDE